MTISRKFWNSAVAMLAAIAVMITDIDVVSMVPSINSAYADDDGGGGGRGGGRNRDRGERADDDRPTLQIFRKRRPRPRRPARVVTRPAQYEPGMLIASGLSDDAITTLTAGGYRIVERHRLGLRTGDVVKLQVPRRMTLEAARQAVRAAAPAALVDFNHYYRPDAGQCIGERCLVRHIAGWPEDSNSFRCGPAQPIGLIDTQINTAHPSLAASRITSIPLIEGDAERSGAKHGTAVAALLVGMGDVTGLLPGWEVIAVDAFRKGDIATGLDLVRAIDILAGREIGVINMSLSGPDNALLRKVIADAQAREIVLVAAAGNDGPRAKPVYPAAYPDVIAVTAVDRNKRIYRRAAQGDHIDIAAPGVNVWTAASVSGQRPRNGTSFAAPFVTAAAALIKASNPGFSSEEIRIVLENQTDDLGKPGRDDVFGWGLLDISGLCRS
jgi:subtilisin family serine protease